MKTALVALSSALTLVGGHLLNRRWDRAVLLFLMLFFLIWLGWAPVLFKEQIGIVSARQLVTGLFIALWLTSLFVTLRDTRRPDGSRQPAWSITGGIAALLLTVWSALLLGWGGALIWGTFDLPEAATSERTGNDGKTYRSSAEVGDHFSHYIYYGHIDNPMADRPEPPSGDGKLVGRIEYEGRPAVGVVLRLFLNSEYRSAPLTTDEAGRFTLAVPPGRWQIDALITNSWPGQPQKELIPLTGNERNLGEGDAFDWSPSRRSSRTVEVSTDGQPPDALVLRFRDPVALAWPEEKRQPADEGDSIEWGAYPGAEKYRVALHNVSRKGDTTSYSPLSARVVEATELPLEMLQSVTTPGEQHEYAVTVSAFDGDGRPLSQSHRFFRHSFILEDDRLIGESARSVLEGTNPTAEDFAQLNRNENRLDAVKLLLDEELSEAAEALLQKVQGPTTSGRREALTAYLRAAQGRCEEARELAQTARNKGADCLPEKYLAACENS